jgi:hypothetical protein
MTGGGDTTREARRTQLGDLVASLTDTLDNAGIPYMLTRSLDLP